MNKKAIGLLLFRYFGKKIKKDLFPLRLFTLLGIYRAEPTLKHSKKLKETNKIKEAVIQVQAKNQLAMSFLYTTFVKEMLTLSFRITNNLSDAEDVVQESFVRSFQKIEQLQEPANYGYWLKRIVINNSIKVTKKRVHFLAIEDGAIKEEDAETNWYEGIQLETINQAIQNLPNGCREILTLYLLEGLKHREIAVLYQIAESTSKSQYRYALKLLKKELSKYLTL